MASQVLLASLDSARRQLAANGTAILPLRSDRSVPGTAIACLVFSVIGLAISVYLTIEHYTGSTTLACSDNGAVNCAKVTKSSWSHFGPIPVALLGLIFFVGQPTQYMGSTPFYIKLSLIALAGLNVGAFYVTGMFRSVEALGPGDDAPMLAKCIAVASLTLWIGVMYCGRMLTFLGKAF